MKEKLIEKLRLLQEVIDTNKKFTADWEKQYADTFNAYLQGCKYELEQIIKEL
jgi:hypothetical protein